MPPSKAKGKTSEEKVKTPRKTTKKVSGSGNEEKIEKSSLKQEVKASYTFEEFDDEELFGKCSDDEIVVTPPKPVKTSKKRTTKTLKKNKEESVKPITFSEVESKETTSKVEPEEIVEEIPDVQNEYILHLPIQKSEIIRLNDNRGSLKKILSENVNKVTSTTKAENTKANKVVYTENVLSNKKMLNMTISSIRCIPHEIDLSQTDLLMSAKTDVLCWWCCHQFYTYPVYLPLFYDKKRSRYKVKGCFCSFNCCYAYGFNDRTVKDKSLIKQMYKSLTGKNDTIIRAPAKEILKSFGGAITIEEFRSHGQVAEYSMFRYPMVYIPQHVEEKKIKQLVKESISKIKDKETMMVPAKPSIIREAKPEPKIQGGNSLRSIIGISVGK